MPTKPSIVFCHGIWADGSSFSKVIPPLQAEGYEVMAAQYGLDTPEGDVATVKRTLGRVGSPAILVGHSYGGSVITAAGTDARVAGLVYIAALAPDANETSQSQQEKYPVTDVFKYVEVADGRLWMRPEGVACFAGDLRRPFAIETDVGVADGGGGRRLGHRRHSVRSRGICRTRGSSRGSQEVGATRCLVRSLNGVPGSTSTIS